MDSVLRDPPTLIFARRDPLGAGPPPEPGVGESTTTVRRVLDRRKGFRAWAYIAGPPRHLGRSAPLGVKVEPPLIGS